MTRLVTVTEANRAFSKIVREVANGQDYLVTSHGRALVRITPANPLYPVVDREEKRRKLVDELLALPERAPGRIIRDDGYD